MSASGSKKWLVVAIVWLLILGACAASFKLFVSPFLRRSADQQAARAEYDRLSQQARQRGMNPSPLSDAWDTAAIQARIAELKQRMTGSQPVNPEATARIRLAIDSFSGYSLFRSRRFADALAQRGLAVELVDDQADYARRIESLSSGDTPLAVFTIDALIKGSAPRSDPPGTIVMVIDETVGADAMVADRQAVPDLDALNNPDARFVVTRDSPSETLARVVMARFSLPALSADPWIDAQGAADVYQQLRAARRGERRAYVLWEPYLSKAIEDSRMHVLIDSGDFRGYIVDVLVAQREFLVEHESQVADVITAYLTARFDQEQQPGGMVDLVRDDARAQLGEQLTPEQARRLVEGIHWKNTLENYAHVGLPVELGGVEVQHLNGMIGNITQVLEKTGAIAADPTGGQPHLFHYDGILRRLHQEDWHPGRLGSGASGTDESVRGTAELAPLSDEQWQRLVKIGTVQIEPIDFDRGQARLAPKSQHDLSRLAETLQSFPTLYLKVLGHARQQGDAQENRRLAHERAAAAANFLLTRGIAAARVRAEAVEPGRGDQDAQSVTFVLGQPPY